MARDLQRAAMRLAMGAGAAGGAAMIAGAALYHQMFRRPLPQTEGTARVMGLDATVTIRRDRWGSPHIGAGSEGDAWFGLGYAHAQDRLAFMAVIRLMTAGRLAEVAGPSALPSDRLMRTLGMRRRAEAEAQAAGRDMLDPLEAYCAGVNAGAASLSAPPFELQLLRLDFEPWRPADIYMTAKLLCFGLSTNWERELLRADLVRELGPERAARIDPPYPAGNPVVLKPGTAYSGDGLALVEQIDAVRELLGVATHATGSNNWAVSGRLTSSGNPLLAGDPHLLATMPSIWCQASVQVGARRARGATVAGFPGIWMGQNSDVIWSFTNVLADVMDLYVERLDGDTYEFEGERRPLELHEETIAVKGRTDDQTLVVRETHHGPLVTDVLGADPGEPLALSWTALRLPCVAPQLLRSLEPSSGEELCESFRDFHLPVSNLVWADRDGNIGYRMVGTLPRRRGGCPDLPKPGWSGEFEWEGWVPFEEMPELTNPECGYVITANNRVVDDDFPHHVTSDWLDGYRARRIEDLLRRSDEHDETSFAEIQRDLYSIPGAETARRLSRLRPSAQREQSAIERLRSWNGHLDGETVAGTIYQAFTIRLGREFCRAVIRDRDLTERYLDSSNNGFLSHVTSPWRWQSHLLALWAEGDEGLIGRSWDSLALEALRGALDDLDSRFGPDSSGWRWGRVHEMRMPHLFADANPVIDRLLSRRVRVGGGQETVCQIAYDATKPFEAIWAPAYRFIADPTDPDAGLWQFPGGQSGHPASPHYDDLVERWVSGDMQRAAGEGPWKTLTLEPERAA